MKCLYVLAFLSLGISVAAQRTAPGRSYHVSPRGSDKNSGIWLDPFKTINGAAGKAMPGDTVIVHAGVYRERITPPRGGSSAHKRIVYRAATGERVVIKGSELIKNWERVDAHVWLTKIPNSFFGNFNPYRERIQGDWFWPVPKERLYHRGAVYLDGHWLMEAAKKEAVMLPPADGKKLLWWAEADTDTTRIWAQFGAADPNKNLVEINVRPVVFYPDKPFVNYITVSGFAMEHAATNWAPPTAEQEGLIGTHWSRGWIIEHNKIQYSKCVGISLGKYGDAYDNNQTESAEGYVGTIKRALKFGWNRATVGGHIVRNNTITYCEQAGIVGSMGGAFSTIQDNDIHDIHINRLFSGAEMAGIKLHGAVDVRISGNRIYRTNMAVWLDWMAQGARISRNLFYENDLDIFLEVNHGPVLADNNLMLSAKNLLMNASGAAFVHNLFSGKIDVVAYDSRLTPYLKPHDTELAALHDNPGGDIQFVNNLFVRGADVRQYSKTLLPVILTGNVYTNGALGITRENSNRRFGEMDATGKEKFKKYREQAAQEYHALADTAFDADVHLSGVDAGMYLEMAFNHRWLQQKRAVVTSGNLAKTIIPDLAFENADGAPIKIDTDYRGLKRDWLNPAPGPFEIKKAGRVKLKVW